MQQRVSTVIVLVVTLATACGESGADLPDASPDAEFSCERSGDEGDSFDMAMGLNADGDFIELADGDPVPLILGNQGFYMVSVELHAVMPLSSDSVCLDCVTELSETGEYGGVTQPGFIGFEEVASGAFSGISTVILGGGNELAMTLDGAEIGISIRCNGHGFSGSVERTVTLYLEE